jgi:hypothetical protein
LRRSVLRTVRGAIALTLLTALGVPLTSAPAHAVLDAPVLVSPSDGGVSGGNPVFTWEAMPGAVKYRFAISQSPTFDPLVGSAVDTVNVQYAPPAKLPLGTVYWRVAAVDAANVMGSYAVSSFQHQWAEAPNLVSPEVDAVLNYPDDPLLFTWDPLAGAKTYNVQVDDDAAFSGAVTTYTTNNTSFTLTAPQTNNQQFFWRVQGVSGAVVSPWSDARPYSIKWPVKPVLLAPGATPVTDVVFSWTPVNGAVKYQLQVSPNQDFANNKILDVITTGPRYSPPTTLDNGSYYWRVRAYDTTTVNDAKANPGEWSSKIETSPGQLVDALFHREWQVAPTLLSPADADYGVTTPTFSWTPVPYATYYEVDMSTDSAFSSSTSVFTCSTNQTTFTPYQVDTNVQGSQQPTYPSTTCETGLTMPPVGAVVYWRVRAIDAPKGVQGIYSQVRSFQLLHQQDVTPVSPANFATVTAPLLTWQPVPGVAQYRVTLIKGNSVTTATTYATSYVPQILVGTYTWYVETIDAAGRAGRTPLGDLRRTFTYALPTDGLTSQPALTAPAAGAASLLMPAMTWTPVTNATKYKVWSGVYGTGTYTELGLTSSPAWTSPAVPRSGSTQAWWVEALDSSNVTLATSEVSTYVVGSLGLAQPTSPASCTVPAECVASSNTPKLEWDPVAGAGGYLVYLAKDPSFTTVFRVYETPYTTVTPREALLDSTAGPAYYWFVRPCRSISGPGGTDCGPFDNASFPTARAFHKSSRAVTLLTADDSTMATPTFAWEDYFATNNSATPASGQEARTYWIETSTDADFSKRLELEEVDQATYTPYDLSYPDGPIYWRVFATDGSQNALTVSAVRKVNKKTPPLTPLHPAAGATESSTPYFQWAAQPHVASYEVEVYKNGDVLYSLSNKVASATSVRLTAWTPTTSLAAGEYAWRVRSRDASGNPVAWTDGGKFTVSKAAATLVSPSDATLVKDNSLLFSWTGVTGAAQYRFESSTSPSFSSAVESPVDTVMTSWAPKAKYPEGTIYWRVKVLDAGGNVLSTSSALSIVKDSVGPTVTAKTPTTKAPVSGGSFTVTFSEPVKGLSASTFVMKVLGSTTTIPGTVTPGATTASNTATFKPSVPLVPGETYALALSAGIADVNGNALTPFTWSVRTDTVVDSASPAVSYFWDRDAGSLASGGAFLASRTSGARVFYTFTGTSVSLLGRRAPDGGYADVYVDGVKQVAKANFYASANQWKVPVWSATGLSNAAHKVEVRVLNSRQTGSTATWVYVDAFKVGTTVTEETSTAVVQAFRTVSLAGALGGTYELETHTATGDTAGQPYVIVRFKGTAISWRGFRGTANGIAGIYVDNVGAGNVDTYGSASSSPTMLFTKTGLSNAQHTLKIVLRGTKQAASTGYTVSTDSFSVT